MSDLIQNKRFELNNEEFNPFDTIIELMNQKDFRMLFESQFNDFSEIKSVILIMKTYHYIEKLYFEKRSSSLKRNYEERYSRINEQCKY